MKKTKRTGKRVVRRIIVLVIVLALIAAGGWFGWDLLKQKYKTTYDAYTATTGSISNALSFTGNLNLIDSAYYTAPSSATVRAVYVAAGDEVKKGDKLIRLGSGSTIEAEFDGRVNVLNVAAGDEVYGGDSLVQVADFTHLKIMMRVDEYDVGDVSVGQKCTVTVTSNERAYESEIAEIDYISASGGNVAYYTATAYVDVDADTLPGMQATVSIPKEAAENVVILKADALSFDVTNQAYVWMKDEAGELKQVFVKTGVSNGNYVEITEGLSDGDEVFVEVREEEGSTLNGLLSGLFGSRQFNANRSMRGMNGANWGGNWGGGMPSMGGMNGGSWGGGNWGGASNTRGGNSSNTRGTSNGSSSGTRSGGNGGGGQR